MTTDLNGPNFLIDKNIAYPCLTSDVLCAPLVPVGDYQFRAYSTGERGTTISPALMREVRNGLIATIEELDISLSSLVSVHTTGALWASLVAAEMGMPLHLFTPSPSNIPGQKKIIQTTGYYSRELYSPDMSQIDDCIVVDDVLSTGGTITRIVNSLRENNCNPQAIVCAIDKGGKAELLGTTLGLPVRCLVDVEQIIG